jgi:hypothetical protein
VRSSVADADIDFRATTPGRFLGYSRQVVSGWGERSRWGREDRLLLPGVQASVHQFEGILYCGTTGAFPRRGRPHRLSFASCVRRRKQSGSTVSGEGEKRCANELHYLHNGSSKGGRDGTTCTAAVRCPLAHGGAV